jgi:hypothetical protein
MNFAVSLLHTMRHHSLVMREAGLSAKWPMDGHLLLQASPSTRTRLFKSAHAGHSYALHGPMTPSRCSTTEKPSPAVRNKQRNAGSLQIESFNDCSCRNLSGPPEFYR